MNTDVVLGGLIPEDVQVKRAVFGLRANEILHYAAGRGWVSSAGVAVPAAGIRKLWDIFIFSRVPRWGTEGDAMPARAATGCVGVEPVYTVKDVAEHLQASKRTVWRAIKNGRIRTMRCGKLVRITAGALRDFLQESSCG